MSGRKKNCRHRDIKTNWINLDKYDVAIGHILQIVGIGTLPNIHFYVFLLCIKREN